MSKCLHRIIFTFSLQRAAGKGGRKYGGDQPEIAEFPQSTQGQRGIKTVIIIFSPIPYRCSMFFLA